MFPRIQPNYGISELIQCLTPATFTPKNLEDAFAKKSMRKRALSFRYGRSGLFYLLKAIDRPGKKVVLSSYTCVVVPQAILEAGYTPVLLDSEPNSPFPSEDSFLNSIDEQTAMVIITHVFGYAHDSKNLIKQIKDKYPKIFILQDCAHSFFASDKSGNYISSLGDGALFGLNISKLVNSVKGGMLAIDDEMLANKIQNLSEKDGAKASSAKSRIYAFLCCFAFTYWGYKITKFILKHTELLNSEVVYYTEGINQLPSDYKNKMNNFEASIGMISLGKYDSRVSSRRILAQKYIAKIEKDGLSSGLPIGYNNPGNTWSHFPFLLNVSQNRLDFIQNTEQLTQAEIGTIIDYTVGNLHGFNDSKSEYPNSESFSKRVINFPISSEECRLSPSHDFTNQMGSILKT